MSFCSVSLRSVRVGDDRPDRAELDFFWIRAYALWFDRISWARAVEDLGIKVGDQVEAVVKATEVMIAK